MKQAQFVDNRMDLQLKQRRLALGISQEEVAFEATLSQTTVSRAERGGRSSIWAAEQIDLTLRRLERFNTGSPENE